MSVTYEIEKDTPFYSSCIWNINQAYYQQTGIEAWRQGVVPHHITSNANVGRIYAHLIFGFLLDQVEAEKKDPIYIVDLGAGHGRLAFHILHILEELISRSEKNIPEYCYVLTDISPSNIHFFENHPQFQKFFNSNKLDIAFFDGTDSLDMLLLKSNKLIEKGSLNSSIVCIANYFFDSIPADLFHFHNGQIHSCLLNTHSPESVVNPMTFFNEASFDFTEKLIEGKVYDDEVKNDIINQYASTLQDAYILFPTDGLNCIDILRSFTSSSTMVLAMDKGFHELHDLRGMQKPDMTTHGSISFWVNFHALASYCEMQNGQSILPKFSNFNVDIGILLFDDKATNWFNTSNAFNDHINDFGPDDMTAIIKWTYQHFQEMSLPELLAMVRLMRYDSTFFINALSRIKHHMTNITYNERYRLLQAMDMVWANYFILETNVDLAFEIGGLCFDLAFYREAIVYFERSQAIYGESGDLYFNIALCYYQLREDADLERILAMGKKSFPNFEGFSKIDELDLDAK